MESPVSTGCLFAPAAQTWCRGAQIADMGCDAFGVSDSGVSAGGDGMLQCANTAAGLGVVETGPRLPPTPDALIQVRGMQEGSVWRMKVKGGKARGRDARNGDGAIWGGACLNCRVDLWRCSMKRSTGAALVPSQSKAGNRFTARQCIALLASSEKHGVEVWSGGSGPAPPPKLNQRRP